MQNAAHQLPELDPVDDSVARYQEQTELLKQHNVDLDNPPENFLPFLKNVFTPENEAAVKALTQSFDPAEEKNMPPQDTLVKMWGWFHGTTGFSVMFLWESGRQDAYVLLDVPTALATSHQIEAQKCRIIQFQDAIDNLKKKGATRG